MLWKGKAPDWTDMYKQAGFRLILVKHSLPEIDPAVSAHQWRLSEEGRHRCSPLAANLATYQPERIVSSREPKALETARILSNKLSKPLETYDSLHEHARWTVKFTGKEDFEALVARFFRQPHDLVFGEETADQAYLRFSRAVAGLLDQYPGQTLVIVTHGTVITLFVAQACGLDPFSFWQSLGLPSFVVLAQPKSTLLEVIENIVTPPTS